MFNLVVPKGVAWSAFEEAREQAYWSSPLAEVVRGLCWANFTQGDRRVELYDKLRTERGSGSLAARRARLVDDMSIELQVFDMTRAPTVEGYTEHMWMVRVLELGHWMYNFLRAHPLFEPCTYCTATDVPPEEEKNAALAVWLDGEIDGGHYFIHNVVNVEMYQTDVFFLNSR